MPRKHATKQSRQKTSLKRNRKPAAKRLAKPGSYSQLLTMVRSVKWSDSYVSLLMGVIVVIVGVLFVVSYLRQTRHIQDTSSTNTIAPIPTAQPSELKPAEKTYTVQKGDDLWHIAEKFYKSGYNWVDIAKANNLSDPSMVFSGNTLIIPSVTPQIATVTITPAPIAAGQDNTAIRGNSYTVQKGDDLWHIAVRAYADGYQWTKIAQANNLSNPDLIFSGNTLQIPR